MKYENLNRIVQNYPSKYLINRFMTKKDLSDVPINLNKFKKYLWEYYKAFPSELETYAKFRYSHSFDEGLPLIEAAMSHKKSDAMKDEMEERLGNGLLSYPIIFIKGENIHEHFYGTTKVNFTKLFAKDRRDKTAKLYKDPFGEAVGISYRNKKGELRYLEFRIAR